MNVYLCGYELSTNLNFDADGDGKSFEGTTCNVILPNKTPRLDFSGCSIDADDTVGAAATYFPADDHF